MQELSLWNKKIFKESLIYNSVDDVIKLILDGKVKEIYIKDKYMKGELPETMLDYDAERCGYNLNYTDNEHLCVLNFNTLYINKSFFLKYCELLKEVYLKYLQNSDNELFIPNFVFDDNVFNMLLNKKCELVFNDVNLTDKQKEMLKEKHILAYQKVNGESQKVSDGCIIATYNEKNLGKHQKVTIYIDDIASSINNLHYYDLVSSIKIENYNSKINDFDNLTLIKHFLIELDKKDRKYDIEFYALNRTLFYKIFKDISFDNLNIIVKASDYDYILNEFMEEEEYLENMVKDIKKSNLSPLEKYLGVYTITKNFKKYKDSINLEEARVLHYILKNDYIVCLGYISLLEALCEIVGINCKPFLIMVDRSYKDGFSVSEIPVNKAGHARALVSIDDEKYNVHGIYVSDPTWDNSKENNYFNHALTTLDKMRMSERMFWFDTDYPILDIHSFDEYNKIVNYLIDYFIREKSKRFQNIDSIKRKEIYLSSLKDVSYRIINMLKCDISYQVFYDMYSFGKNENDFYILLTEIGHYLLSRVNNPVNEEVIINAALESMELLFNKEETKNKIMKKYYEKEKKVYPYMFDVNISHKLWDRK